MKTKVNPVDLLVALLAVVKSLAIEEEITTLRVTKGCKRHSFKYLFKPRKRLRLTEINVFLKSFWSMPPLSVPFIVSKVFCGLHYALGTSFDNNSQLLCSKQLNHLEGFFFCNTFDNNLTSSTAICLMTVFLFSMLLKWHYEKL